MVDFFAHHAADRTRAGHGFNEDVVADDVELLLVFALNVFRPGQAEYAGESAVADFEADFLAGFRHAHDETREDRVKAVERLFAGEILMERHGHDEGSF